MKRQLLLMMLSGLAYLLPVVALLVHSSVNPPQHYQDAVALVRDELFELVNGRVFSDSFVSSQIERGSLEGIHIASLDRWWHTLYSNDALDNSAGYDKKETALFKKLAVQVESNQLADYLNSFQDLHPEYKEIIVTDPQGHLLAMTNVTSDFLQSDEEWWKTALPDGTIGDIEYDESAANWVLPITFRINDEDNSFLGVIKVLIDITTLSRRRRL